MIRLNKFIAAAGLASRRQADLLIQQGQVQVNGMTITELGMQVDPQSDLVTLGNQTIRPESTIDYLILNKPPGYLTTVRDPFDRPTVMNLLPPLNSRVYPVGRLDFDTSGLLFFTNDGEIALALTHPRHLVEKVYLATVRGIPTNEALQQLAAGIILEDGPTAPAKIGINSIANGNAIVSLTIREGRKRQIKRMLQAIGHPVTQLQRIAMGPLTLGGLGLGHWRRLSKLELAALLRLKTQLKQKNID
jgi:23S rRNA pseudouridine2605 synthase